MGSYNGTSETNRPGGIEVSLDTLLIYHGLAVCLQRALNKQYTMGRI